MVEIIDNIDSCKKNIFIIKFLSIHDREMKVMKISITDAEAVHTQTEEKCIEKQDNLVK